MNHLLISSEPLQGENVRNPWPEDGDWRRLPHAPGALHARRASLAASRGGTVTTHPAHRRATSVVLERALPEGPLTLRELSQRVGVSERQLEAPGEEPQGRGLRLLRGPAHYLACGFLFRDRQRMTRAQSLSQCKSERVEPATFQLVGA
ncbi:MAG: hypothetical protein R3B07_30975 [Polyangiaceae bacterium]